MFRGLSTASLPVVQLFDSPYLFSIPPYQRPYSWTTKEAGQLFEDVVLASGCSEHARMSDYFLGTILVLDPELNSAEPSSVPLRPRVYEVVDGQQRLLTLAILAAALRDVEDTLAGPTMSPRDPMLADRLDAMIRVEHNDHSIATRPARIQLRGHEQAFFEAHVVARHPRLPLPEPEDAEGTEELQTVCSYFASELQGMSHEERRKLALYLIEDCHVVVIVTRDIDGAHRLFSVLNERGKPLQRKDILKAEVLRSVPSEFAIEALGRWDRASAQLGGGFESFFSHIRFIHDRNGPAIIASVRALVQRLGTQPFLTEVFTPLADSFAQLRTYGGDLNVLRNVELATSITALNRLGQVGQADWVPAAILAMSHKATSPQVATALVLEIERLAYMLRIVGQGAGKRQRRFGAVVDAIRANPKTALAAGVFELSREEEKLVAYHLRDLHKRCAPLSKLVLMRTEDELAGTPLTVDPAELSVEHVLPSRPSATSDWRRQIPDTELRSACQQSLGNLVLLSHRKNDRARNKDFAAKLEIYREPEAGELILVSNADLLSATAWNAETIKARESRTMAVLAKIWRIDPPRA
jgi:hypothetical protein